MAARSSPSMSRCSKCWAEMEEVDPAAPPSVAELPSRLTRAELAQLWRVSLRTIERVLYRRDDVLAFEQAQIDRTAG
jgi:hypothetical protein